MNYDKWRNSYIICNTKGELSMQKCSHCSSQFKRKNIIKSVWLRSYSPIRCENCNTQHYFNVSTRLICGLSIGAPMFILQGLFHYGYYVLLKYILWLALVMYLTPSFARYI
jgi:CXXC-20-CXXC protein